MRNILRLFLVAIATAGLFGVTASPDNAESLQYLSGTHSISGSDDPGTGDKGALSEGKEIGQDGKPAAKTEKSGLKRNDAKPTDDGPSMEPGFHEWIDRGNDCEKKEQLERQFREQMERQHQ